MTAFESSFVAAPLDWSDVALLLEDSVQVVLSEICGVALLLACSSPQHDLDAARLGRASFLRQVTARRSSVDAHPQQRFFETSLRSTAGVSRVSPFPIRLGVPDVRAGGNS